MSKRLLATCCFFVSAAFSFAVPLFDEPIPSITLTTGEVLHDVQAKGFSSASVLVKYRDGAKTVPYEQFPTQYRDILLARKPRPSSPPASKPTIVADHTADHAAEKPKKVTRPDRLTGEQFKGLTLMSTHVVGSYAVVEIYNDNAETVTLDPGSLQAELDNGKIVLGRHWIDVDEEGNVAATLKGTQEISPKSSVTLKVSLLVPPNVNVVHVVWSQN